MLLTALRTRDERLSRSGPTAGCGEAVGPGPSRRLILRPSTPRRRHLLEPLRAELLLALTYHKGDNCSTAASCNLAGRLPRLVASVAALDLSPMLELGWLVRTMEALPHWPAVLRAFGSRNRSRLGGGGRRTAGKVRCERNPLWNASRSAAGGPGRSGNPYRCSGIFLGNSIFAPVLHVHRMNTAWAPHGHRVYNACACAPHVHVHRVCRCSARRGCTCCASCTTSAAASHSWVSARPRRACRTRTSSTRASRTSGCGRTRHSRCYRCARLTGARPCGSLRARTTTAASTTATP